MNGSRLKVIATVGALSASGLLLLYVAGVARAQPTPQPGPGVKCKGGQIVTQTGGAPMLDVYVQDDTNVDYLTLTVHYY